MIAPEGKNGGGPSKNGGSEKSAEAPHDGPEVVLVLCDRLDALERLVGTVRRRGMTLRVHSLVRRGEDLVMVLRADRGVAVPDRWIAELGALHDVSEIKVTGIPAATR